MTNLKLAVSNIAWEVKNDSVVHDYLVKNGVSGVEIAPTVLWGGWANIELPKVRAYGQELRLKGLSVPALQAIFYGCEFSIFNKDSWDDVHTHLASVCHVANALGAEVLVFGAPKLRARGGINYFDAFQLAVELFESLGRLAHQHGCTIGLEANPVEYGCDFLTNVSDVIALLSNLETKGVQLHIDVGANMLTLGVPVTSEMLAAAPVHFHVSAPMLSPVSREGNDFSTIRKILAEGAYEEWISMEMRNPGSWATLRQSIDVFVTELNTK